MVAIQFDSAVAAQFWEHLRRPRIAGSSGSIHSLTEVLTADSLERLGIATPHAASALPTAVEEPVKKAVLMTVDAYAKVGAQIQIDPVDVPAFGTGEPIFVRREVQEHSWVQSFRRLREGFNQKVDQALLLRPHMERVTLLHANGHLSDEQFVRAVEVLARIDRAGIEAKRLAWEADRLAVLGSLMDLRMGVVEEIGTSNRVRDATELLNGAYEGTDEVLDRAAGMLRSAGYSCFNSHRYTVPIVDRFVEAVKDFRVGRGLATLSVLGLAFGAWQLFGGEAAHSRLSKVASLGLNAVGMLGCTLASPLAIAGTIVSAGFLAMEAHDFFGKQAMEMV